MSKRVPGPKLKVNRERPDITVSRDSVAMLLKYFGYPALMSAKALESAIYRERQANMKKDRK